VFAKFANTKDRKSRKAVSKMTELQIKPEDIRSAIERNVANKPVTVLPALKVCHQQ